jgi:hypothetical protein
LGNQGIHQMDIARWMLNRSELPRGVIALGGRFGYQDQGETPNTLIAAYDYGDADLLFEVRGLKTDALRGVKIGDLVYGANGYVAVTDNYAAAAAFDNDGNPVKEFRGGGNHFRNFLDAVKSRRASDLHAPVNEGHLSSALCHLGNVSYKLGKPGPVMAKPAHPDVDVAEAFGRFEKHLAENGIVLGAATYRLGRALRFDPKRGRFLNDKEADRLLTRAYRAPFTLPRV